jgi:hypothetical protein
VTILHPNGKPSGGNTGQSVIGAQVVSAASYNGGILLRSMLFRLAHCFLRLARRSSSVNFIEGTTMKSGNKKLG